MRNHTAAAPRLEQTIAAIESLDLEPIKRKLSHKEDGPGWTAEHADRIERGYRQYLTLLAKYPQMQISPTRDIDAFWHAHILDTRKYAADCERVFGGFVHHDPNLGMDGNPDQARQAADNLYALFLVEFGAEVPSNAGRKRAGDKQAAWCAGEPPADKRTAWCAGEPPADKRTAWCAGEPPADTRAAWCAGEPPADTRAAWCAGEPPADKRTAWCAGEPPADKKTVTVHEALVTH